jgi:hypothetical protein
VILPPLVFPAYKDISCFCTYLGYLGDAQGVKATTTTALYAALTWPEKMNPGLY